MESNKLEFDDLVEEKDGTKWSQVCTEHAKAFPQKSLEETPVAKLICGVKGCKKQAKYYVTL